MWIILDKVFNVKFFYANPLHLYTGNIFFHSFCVWKELIITTSGCVEFHFKQLFSGLVHVGERVHFIFYMYFLYVSNFLDFVSRTKNSTFVNNNTPLHKPNNKSKLKVYMQLAMAYSWMKSSFQLFKIFVMCIIQDI